MILSVYLAMPDIDNKRRSIKITEGVRAGKAAGRWMGIAPYGYKNARDEQNKPIIIPDEKAAIVKKVFGELARGKRQAEIQAGLQKKGIILKRSSLLFFIIKGAYSCRICV